MKTNTPSANALMLRISKSSPSRERGTTSTGCRPELLRERSEIEFFAIRLFEITKNID